MANTVKIRNSSTASAAPSSLEAGELAINTADGTLFWEDSSGSIQTTYLLPAFDDLSSTSHASTHATGGSDAIAPADIGAAPAVSPTFTGDVTIPDKIIHSGDSNTAIRFPAADTFTVETDGVERLRVDSSGRVRVGAEKGPLHILEVQASDSTTLSSQIASAGGFTGRTAACVRNTSATTGSFAGQVFLVTNASATNQIASIQCVSTASGFSPDIAFTRRNAGTTSALTMVVKGTGAVRFVPLAADPASGNEAGDVYYNSTSNKLRVYNGTSWVDLH